MAEHVASVVSMLIFFSFLAAIILGPRYLRFRERERMNETLRAAFEKGQPVPPEIITALQSNIAPTIPPTPERDLRRAVVFMALGLGLCGLGYGMWYGLSSVSYRAAYITGGAIAGVGAIPGLVGLAYLVLWATRRSAAKD